MCRLFFVRELFGMLKTHISQFGDGIKHKLNIKLIDSSFKTVFYHVILCNNAQSKKVYLWDTVFHTQALNQELPTG